MVMMAGGDNSDTDEVDESLNDDYGDLRLFSRVRLLLMREVIYWSLLGCVRILMVTIESLTEQSTSGLTSLPQHQFWRVMPTAMVRWMVRM